MESSSARLFIFAVGATIFSCWVLFGYLVEARHIARLQANGIETLAVVTSLWRDKGRYGDGSCIVDVRFRLNGRTQQSQSYVTKQTFDRLSHGEKVQVKYVNEDPSKVWFVGEGNPWASRLWFCGAGFAVAVLLVLLARRQQAAG